MDPSTILASVIFGGIGFAAFVYGKKQSESRPMLLGIALMGYPYLIQNTIAQYVIGIVLTLALFVWR